MPDLRGPEVESAVRVFLPGVPFLYMSGYREFGEEETGDEPSRETVAKPFSPSEIARRVRAAIDRAAVRGAEKE
jgi:two-component system cell cycle sensor histidine kinase/response regulator CckA